MCYWRCTRPQEKAAKTDSMYCFQELTSLFTTLTGTWSGQLMTCKHMKTIRVCMPGISPAVISSATLAHIKAGCTQLAKGATCKHGTRIITMQCLACAHSHSLAEWVNCRQSFSGVIEELLKCITFKATRDRVCASSAAYTIAVAPPAYNRQV